MPDKNTASLSLIASWMTRWQEALDLWSSFIRLKDPVFCETAEQEQEYGLSQSFALIDLHFHQVAFSVTQIDKLGLEDFPLEIMGHEIGHHILCPNNLADHVRMLAIMRHSLPTREDYAPMIANLYSDLLINDRLFREHDLKMDQIYLKLKQDKADKLWDFYMRTYEILWALPRNSLTSQETDKELDLDARLAHRIIRNSVDSWLRSAGLFASLCLKYLLMGEQYSQGLIYLQDAARPGPGNIIPDGLIEIDEMEAEEIGQSSLKPVAADKNQQSTGQYRQPFEYGEILRAAGIDLSDQEIAIRYYKERAIPYLLPFPGIEQEAVTDPTMEGMEVWDFGESLNNLNIMESLFRSPVLIPGYTTLQRTYGQEQGQEKEIIPMDLDLYVDCSGSMPNPQSQLSWLTLAGTIIALSALRYGARVQATLWSGTNEFYTTPGFVNNEQMIMEVLTGFFGNGTAFPIHMLRKTYVESRPRRRTHILVISDEGVDTILMDDEKGNKGAEISAQSLENCGAGGSMVLNLWQDYRKVPALKKLESQGWNIYPISNWEDLLVFAREFVRKKYGEMSV